MLITCASLALILPLAVAQAPVADVRYPLTFVETRVRDHCWTLTAQFEKPAENRIDDLDGDLVLFRGDEIDGYRERQKKTLGALGLVLDVMALRNATNVEAEDEPVDLAGLAAPAAASGPRHRGGRRR